MKRAAISMQEEEMTATMKSNQTHGKRTHRMVEMLDAGQKWTEKKNSITSVGFEFGVRRMANLFHWPCACCRENPIGMSTCSTRTLVHI